MISGYNDEAFIKLARAILSKSIRAHDRYTYDRDWLDVLCGLTGITADVYFEAIYKIYGDRVKDNEDEDSILE